MSFLLRRFVMAWLEMFLSMFRPKNIINILIVMISGCPLLSPMFSSAPSWPFQFGCFAFNRLSSRSPSSSSSSSSSTSSSSSSSPSGVFKHVWIKFFTFWFCYNRLELGLKTSNKPVSETTKELWVPVKTDNFINNTAVPCFLLKVTCL